MQQVNILQFNLTDLQQVPWRCCTKPQSLTWGRHLYQLHLNGDTYWLKTQFKNTYAEVEARYVRELAFYQEQQTQLTCLLPMQQIDLSECDGFQHTYPSLLLPHATPWLSDPNVLSLDEIQHKILLLLAQLQELADLGWIHADLKHEHFVNWYGQCKLLDFEQAQHFTQINLCLNATPRYMAPELFHVEAKTLQTELYALGIILYEWLSGQRLSAKTYTDWAYLHCQHLNIQLPTRYQSFYQLICTLTAKLKQHRFTNILAVKQAIQQIKS